MTPLRLPQFATHRTKYLWGVVVAFLTYLLYNLTNHFLLFEATVLPFMPFEEALPVLPWTIWPYLTSFLVMVYIFFDVRDLDHLHRLTYAFLALQLVSNLTFVLFPVTMPPRELFPVPDDVGPVTGWLFAYTRAVDTTRNCLPSLHVANCTLISLVYVKERRPWKLLLAVAWLLLVSFSTLGTKQHYFWDVLGGFAVALVLFRMAFDRRFLLITPRARPAPVVSEASGMAGAARSDSWRSPPDDPSPRRSGAPGSSAPPDRTP